MRITLIGVLAAALAATATVTPAAATTPSDLTRAGVHLVGDSLSNALHRSVLRPGRRPPGWTTDGYPGRRAGALDTWYVPRTTDYTRAISHIFDVKRTSRIRTAVLELGTNGLDGDVTVDEAARMYAEAVQRIRYQPVWHTGPKRVVLVTPWRDPAIAPGAVNPATGQEYLPYTWAYKGKVYAQAIRRVAAASTYVCVMPWDRVVAADPSLLHDGVHPSAAGRVVYRDLLFRTIRTCGK